MAAASEAPNLVVAMNIGTFNLGNTIDDALGAGVMDAGLKYPAVSLAGASMAVLALVMQFAFGLGPRSVTVARR